MISTYKFILEPVILLLVLSASSSVSASQATAAEKCSALADEYCPSIVSFTFRTGELPLSYKDVPWAQIKDSAVYRELCVSDFQKCLDAIDHQFDTGSFSCPYTDLENKDTVPQLYGLIGIYYGRTDDGCGHQFGI